MGTGSGCSQKSHVHEMNHLSYELPGAAGQTHAHMWVDQNEACPPAFRTPDVPDQGHMGPCLF